MHSGRDERPDSLVIMDDNLVEPVTAGIAAAGIKTPEDLDIIAHCKYPHLPASAVNVTWAGYNIRAVINDCANLISNYKPGQTLPDHVDIPVKFLNELESIIV
jgi:DNA-binding LacI/PurR family transcriptional regulator